MSELPCMVQSIDGKVRAYRTDGTEVPYTGEAARKATFIIGVTGKDEHQRSVTKREFDDAVGPRPARGRARAKHS